MTSAGDETRGPLRRGVNFLAAAPLVLLGPLVLAVGLTAGCAGTPVDARGPVEALTGQAPAAAYYHVGSLYLRYLIEDKAVFFVAEWPTEDLSRTDHNYRVAALDVYDGPPIDERRLRAGGETVAMLPRERWDAIVEELLGDLAPPASDEAALLGIQGSDIVLHRDAAGRLRVYVHERKPAALRVTRFVSEDAFSARANMLLAERRAAGRLENGPLLFSVDAAGDAFVFFDLVRNQSVFITRPPTTLPLNSQGQIGFSLRMADALLVQSHVLTPITRPVTSLNRLIWLATQSGTALLPRGLAVYDEPPPPVANAAPMDLEAWERTLDAMASPRYRGTMRPLIDGDAFFTALVQAIQDAKRSVDVRLYIFDRDDYALRIADLLKRRSTELEVRVLLDYVGTLTAGQIPARSPYYSAPPTDTPSILDYLRDGSAVAVRTTENPWLTGDHTKAIIVDRRLAFVGGMNIGREYRYEWHDLMVAVEGPIVGRLAHDFEKRWVHAGIGGDLAFAAAAGWAETYEGPPERTDYMDLRPLYTRTGDLEILRAQLGAIQASRRYIWVEQAYVADDAIVAGLIEARRRGVDVRLVLPSRSDSGFMNGANLLATNVLVRNGVRVYAYPGMTHVKAAIYDGWACLGSANFDKLSLRVNQELNLATSDPRFVERLRRELFAVDFARSHEVTALQRVGWEAYVAEFIADQL